MRALAVGLCLGWAVSAAAQIPIEVNKPRSIFDCDTKVAEEWYGSEERCLEDLCTGESVTNRYIQDDRGDRRLRKNPCYGMKPR
jgi:hypothetical protein